MSDYNYNLSMMQSWSLEPEAGCRIELKFDPFFDVKTIGTGLEDDCATGSCNWDWVGISYKSFCMRLCAMAFVKPFAIEDGEKMDIEFNSDSVNTGKGFEATWNSVNADVPIDTDDFSNLLKLKSHT